MKIDSLEQLEAVLDLMQRKGCHTAVIDGMTLQLQLGAHETKDAAHRDVFIDPMTGQPMSDEDIMMWGARDQVRPSPR